MYIVIHWDRDRDRGKVFDSAACLMRRSWIGKSVGVSRGSSNGGRAVVNVQKDALAVDGNWCCESCSLVNVPEATICALCDRPSKISYAVPAGSDVLTGTEEGIVECARCTFHNTVSASACDMCGHTLVFSVAKSSAGERTVSLKDSSSADVISSHVSQRFENSVTKRRLMSLSVPPLGSDEHATAVVEEDSMPLDHDWDLYNDHANDDHESACGEWAVSCSEIDEESDKDCDGKGDDDFGESSVPLRTQNSLSEAYPLIEIHSDIEDFSEDDQNSFTPHPSTDIDCRANNTAPALLPHLSQHYWSVKQLSQLKCCKVNFNLFTLDNGATNPNGSLSGKGSLVRRTWAGAGSSSDSDANKKKYDRRVEIRQARKEIMAQRRKAVTAQRKSQSSATKSRSRSLTRPTAKRIKDENTGAKDDNDEDEGDDETSFKKKRKSYSKSSYFSRKAIFKRKRS